LVERCKKKNVPSQGKEGEGGNRKSLHQGGEGGDPKASGGGSTGMSEVVAARARVLSQVQKRKTR